MSYIKAELMIAVINRRTDKGYVAEDDFRDGLEQGFAIALRAYGIWNSGTQVIGCQEERVIEILEREFGKGQNGKVKTAEEGTGVQAGCPRPDEAGEAG